MRISPLKSIPFILRPQAWLHRRNYGVVLEPIYWWGRIPFIFYLLSMFVAYLERKSSRLDPLIRCLVSARISQLCVCDFCIDINNMKIAKHIGGIEKLLDLSNWRESIAFDSDEKLALSFAEAVSATPPSVDDAMREALIHQFGIQALTELTALIGLQNLSARFNAAMEIPAQGFCELKNHE